MKPRCPWCWRSDSLPHGLECDRALARWQLTHHSPSIIAASGLGLASCRRSPSRSPAPEKRYEKFRQSDTTTQRARTCLALRRLQGSMAPITGALSDGVKGPPAQRITREVRS